MEIKKNESKYIVKKMFEKYNLTVAKINYCQKNKIKIKLNKEKQFLSLFETALNAIDKEVKAFLISVFKDRKGYLSMFYSRSTFYDFLNKNSNLFLEAIIKIDKNYVYKFINSQE